MISKTKTKLITENGNTLVDRNDMLNEQVKFHDNLDTSLLVTFE